MKYYKFNPSAARNCTVKLFADQKIYQQIEDTALEQLFNASQLPGVKGVVGLPDLHQGYGLPIGGVIASDFQDGIVSPGAVGFDINCGVRLLTSQLNYQTVNKKLKSMINKLRKEIPAGVGKQSKLHFDQARFKQIVEGGVPFLINELGYGKSEDINNCEENGQLPKAKANKVSPQAAKRGQKQLGTLGSGNHFLEIQRVEKVWTEDAELTTGQLCIMIHTGSRGYGHQIAQDYINQAKQQNHQYNFSLPTKNLAAFPAQSEAGQNYLQAMRCAANFAFANRQLITHHVREKLRHLNLNLNLYYDITHNTVKQEEHAINGQRENLLVHRKGATKPSPEGIAIIPGSMGTSSYIVKAKRGAAIKESFNSLAHGAGRTMSRRQAKKTISQQEHNSSLAGIQVVSGSNESLLDESPAAYKDIDLVIKSLQKTGLAQPIAKLKPLAVLKG